ncbi:MobF family relaxase [Dermacoccus sp. PE3]|uniref:MobF family relaxase n=1 Tax=Dermacoccus sp. PE3 TaxID=1641401 RepID=UPI00069A6A72|nr:MobF family relaxase [Dermacoccus sp. PE3]
MGVTLMKLSAGSGYTYLTKQVARGDVDKTNGQALADYYSEKGERPGQWMGRGLDGLGEANGLQVGDTVTEQHMKNLFGQGVHPNADRIMEDVARTSTNAAAIEKAGRLGNPFKDATKAASPYTIQLTRAYNTWLAANGKTRDDEVPEETKAELQTEVAGRVFAETHGRAARDAREISSFITAQTRQEKASVAGYDLTFSAPKSFTILWAAATPEQRADLEAVHDAAVRESIAWLEDNATFTRTGKAGVRQVSTRGLMATAFTHRDSRDGDPHLHTHVAISSKVQLAPGESGGQGDPDRWLALDGQTIYKTTVSVSERYNRLLEAKSRALGLAFEARAGSGEEGKQVVREVAGISPELIESMSSRRAEIRAKINRLATEFQTKHGRPPTVKETYKLSRWAHEHTRKEKAEPRSLNDQLATWTPRIDAALADEASPVPGGASGLFAHAQRASARARERQNAAPKPTSPEAVSDLAGQMVARITSKRAMFDLGHVRAEAERTVRPFGLSESSENTLIEGLIAAVQDPTHSTRIDAKDPVLEPDDLRRADGTSVYRRAFSQKFTTTAILEAEAALLQAAQTEGGRTLEAANVDLALLEQTANGVTLNDGQAQLVREMTTSGRMVQLALAPAGTGKTTAMSVLTKAWTDSGGTVIGLAPSAAAAKVLGSSIETSADTLDKLVWHIRGGAGEAPAWMDTIDENTMVIIDEAGMAGTENLATAIQFLNARGAQVRLIGDDQQLASPAAGGALRNIKTDVGALTLSEVVRFTTPGEAEASLAVRAGKTEALGFYLDADRVWVGNEAGLADAVFEQWQEATRLGRETLMMAHVNEVVTDLNARARHARLAISDAPVGPSVALRSGLEASTGDTIVTRKNNRRLMLSATDFVKNGDRWTITDVRVDGSLRVEHNTLHRSVTLPADYVREQVDLGYASTFHGAQGQTVDEGLALLNGSEDRQLFYVGTTRGRHANHIFMPTGGDGDEHNEIAPEVLVPPTTVESLEAIITRDGSVISATTTLRDEHDPRTLLAKSLPRYEDALAHAAANILGSDAMDALAREAEDIVPGVTSAPAWDTLHSHLAFLALDDVDPLAALRDAADERALDGSRDIAAVLDWRLDATGSHSARSGPLPWVPGIPESVSTDATYGAWVRERYELVQTDAAALRDDVRALQHEAAPEWARAFLDTPELHADLAVWRAATNTDDDDPAIVGRTRLSVRQRTYQDVLRDRAERHAPTVANAGAVFAPAIEAVEPRVLTDPWWPTLAARLDAAHTAGRDVATILDDVLGGDNKPLPDEHTAAALWSRVLPHLGATAAADATGAATGRLRPAWTSALEDALGAELAGWVISDPAWPTLVATVTERFTTSGHPAEEIIANAVDRIGAHSLPVPGADHEDGRLGVHELASVLLWRLADTSITAEPEPERIGEGDLHDPDIDAYLTRLAAEHDSARHTANRVPEQARAEARVASREDARRDENEWAPSFTTSSERVIELTTAAHEFYRAHYTDSPAAAYIARRFGSDLSETPFKLGHAPMSADKPWNARDLVTHLRETKHATDTELVEAGLAKWNKGGQDVYDLFRNRVMIPVRGKDGRPIGFHARALDDSPAKYLNSPETPAFTKGATMIGMYEGFQHARAQGAATQPATVRVEGPLDAIAITLAGDGVMMGASTGGTAFTDTHADMLATLARDGKVYLALDNDNAGRAATRDAFWKLTSRGVDARSIPIPGAKDPGELYENDPTMLRMVLTSPNLHPSTAVDVAHHIARTYEAGTDTATIENTVLAARQAAQAVAVLPVEQWDEVITQAAPSFTRDGEDTAHAANMLWAETLAAGIDWPTDADPETLTPQQAQASEAKLEQIEQRLTRSAGIDQARANMDQLRDNLRRLQTERDRPRDQDVRTGNEPSQGGVQR